MAVARRSRSKAGSTPTAELKTLVDSLIKENQRLKKQLLRVEAKATGGAGAAAARGLGAIARRLEKALGAGSTSRRTRRNTSTAAKAARRSAAAPTPRKPTSRETQAKRLAALAKAREARAAKRNQESPSNG